MREDDNMIVIIIYTLTVVDVHVNIYIFIVSEPRACDYPTCMLRNYAIYPHAVPIPSFLNFVTYSLLYIINYYVSWGVVCRIGFLIFLLQ